MKVQLRDRNSKKEMLVTKNTVREMNNAINNLIRRWHGHCWWMNHWTWRWMNVTSHTEMKIEKWMNEEKREQTVQECWEISNDKPYASLEYQKEKREWNRSNIFNNNSQDQELSKLMMNTKPQI